MNFFFVFDKDKTNIWQAGLCRQTSITKNNSYTETIEPHTFNLYWFLFHLLRLCFQHRIKEPFYTDQYERWRVWKTGATSPVLQWFGIKWHTHGFQPPHGLLGQIYAPCCGFIQDMCVCAMRKVQWAHDGNMQAFVGIFLFFPGAALLFFNWEPFCCYFAFLEN